MPVYNLACRQPLVAATREKVAHAITDAHCRITGAPAQFVNVVCLDGYPFPDGPDINAIGGVRQGGNRTAEVIEQLRSTLQNEIAAAAERSTQHVSVTLIGVPSSWVMEGGRVMPEPGAEDDWLSTQSH